MNEISFIPFPTLTTKRLILRQVKIEDENEIFALRSDARVLEFLDRPRAKTIDEARQFINKINEGITKNKWIYWAITLKYNFRLIGTICLWKISKEHSKAEIGYELLPNYQGKGIMQEALTTVIEYGFENMQLHSIEADLDPNNMKSIKLLERNNFMRVAKIKENDSYDEKILDTVVYVLNAEFKK